jgi:hypothetical protein
MSLYPKIIAVYLSLPRHVFWLVVLSVVALGLFSENFLNGAELTTASCIQAALSAVVFHYVITLFLYRKYQSNTVQKAMESSPVKVICAAILFVITILLLYALYFFFTKAISAYS